MAGRTESRPLPSLASLLAPRSPHAGRPRVLILVAPFVEVSCPPLGPSALAAACLERHIDCRVFYASLGFAAAIGHERYQRLLRAMTPLATEALFARHAFGSDMPDFVGALAHLGSLEISRDFYCGREAVSTEEYLECHAVVPAFLDYAVQTIVEAAPDVLGLSLLSEQNTASLAIAKRVKGVLSHIVTVAGGCNATHPMGNALREIAPFIDCVFSGYADQEFPRFCADLAARGSLPDCRSVICAPLDDLDALEMPDHTDYLAQLRVLQSAGLLPGHWPAGIPFESSRGCWWGERSRCAFCGLTGPSLPYRQKSVERMTREIDYLATGYGVDHLFAVDNVIPEGVEDALEKARQSHERLRFLYEVRSDLPLSRVDALVRAGVVLMQPGIESLSSSVLRRMRKGVTALQNLTFLREARSRQLSLMWNFLPGVPGETRTEYDEVLALLPLIEHFQPPITLLPVCLQRFSPYLTNPAEFGIADVRPLAGYGLIYPPHADLHNLAFYFDAEYESAFLTCPDLRRNMTDGIRRWARLWEDGRSRPRLARVPMDSGVRMIADTRSVAKQTFTALDAESSQLLSVLSQPLRPAAIPDRLKPSLAELLERHFVLFHEGHYLSLVTDPSIGMNLRRERKVAGRGVSPLARRRTAVLRSRRSAQDEFAHRRFHQWIHPGGPREEIRVPAAESARRQIHRRGHQVHVLEQHPDVLEDQRIGEGGVLPAEPLETGGHDDERVEVPRHPAGLVGIVEQPCRESRRRAEATKRMSEGVVVV